jgi:hypothetical protein
MEHKLASISCKKIPRKRRSLLAIKGKQHKRKITMQIISSRVLPFIDSQSLVPGEAREVLFREARGSFLLYLSNGEPDHAAEERVLCLGLREALVWLNEPPQDQGSFWV